MRLRSWIPDTLGVLWVLAAAFAVLLPALVHGSSLGSYDILSQYSLSRQPGMSVHNWRLIDQITAIIPSTSLAWTQVHSGHLPLWNPYSLLGMPLAFDWLAAPFSVQALVGYLFPLDLAYTVQIVVTLVIAGTGVYVLGRMLGLGVMGSVMAATVCELSGPYMAWLGWPVIGTMAWAGWFFAAALLVVRGRHRVRSIALLAVVSACLIYSGSPENTIVLVLGLAVFVVVVLAFRARSFKGTGPIGRPALDLILAGIAGAALCAPQALPGLEVVDHSGRSLAKFTSALPAHSLVGVILQGFDGLPEASSQWFDHSGWFPLYLEAYVGVIAVVLAVAAVALRRRRPEVVGFGVVVLVTAAFTFVAPFVEFLRTLPFHLGRVQWAYALDVMAFALAVLAGVGTDVLVRSRDKRAVWYWVGGGFLSAGVLLLAVWIFGRGDLPSIDAGIRARSFIWPAIETTVGLTVVGALVAAHRHRGGHVARSAKVGTWAVAALIACETAFLVAAGAPVTSSSPTPPAPTPAEIALQRVVGSSVLGCGSDPCFTALGIVPDANVLYHVREFGVFDPSTPLRYSTSWSAATGQSGLVNYNVFSPKVLTTAVARLYGIGYVVESAGTPGPPGSVFDREIGDEDLYRVPGAAVATLSPRESGGAIPKADAAGSPVAVTHPGPASWKLTTDKATPQVLRLRLTDVPGWHASIDGHPLKLYPFAGIMLQALVPPGRHTVELHYWPTTFTEGIVLALCSAAALLFALLFSWTVHRGRRRQRPPTS